MIEAPLLPVVEARTPVKGYALLLNPFYPKDPVASFGKHVLTPSLALTSIAGATPAHWKVRYHDEVRILKKCKHDNIIQYSDDFERLELARMPQIVDSGGDPHISGRS